MDDPQNSLPAHSPSPPSPGHQPNGIIGPITASPSSINPPPTSKPRIYCLNKRRTLAPLTRPDDRTPSLTTVCGAGFSCAVLVDAIGECGRALRSRHWEEEYDAQVVSGTYQGFAGEEYH